MLYFVDESGIDLKQAPCVVLAGVAIREADVWPLTQAFMDLSAAVLRFPPEMGYEIKGAKLLKTRVFRHAALLGPLPDAQRNAAVDRLLTKNEKGDDVGREELAALAQAKLIFVERALGLAADFGMTVFASIVPRDAPQQRDRSILRKDFAYLFQRIHCHVCDQEDHDHGVLIFDEQDPALSQRLMDQIHKYFRETGRGQQRAERMIPMPFFVHSELTPAIQIADLVAYIVNWGLRLDRMPEPVREELKPFADRTFDLRYSGREVPLKRRIGKRGKHIWGIAYIPDLRPRTERTAADDETADLDEVEAPQA
ncbi:MAG: DUF3800 domain-containing protein [Thermoleophilia bacterium]|nr:DUF3800 domain-containing protein [Thermoleophilia bacterium]